MRKLLLISFGLILYCGLFLLLFSNLKNSRVQAQQIELPCPAGMGQWQPLVSRNPNTGGIRQYGCVDSNGNVSFNGLFTSITSVSSNALATITYSGTGACASFNFQTFGAVAGKVQCTGVTGVTTLTLTPGNIVPPNGFVCSVTDITSGFVLAETTPISTASCKVTSGATSITNGDTLTYSIIGF